MEELKDLGKRIERVKNHFNYSNGQLGEVCGVSYTAIAKIIHGATKDPSVSIFIKLCKILKLNINWLLFNEGSMFSDSESLSLHSDHDQEITRILLRTKEEENEMLKKMVRLLEDRLAEMQAAKRAS